MKNLFVNGCSFLNRRNTPAGHVRFSTAECIKDLGGFESMTNLARGGRGNDRIFLTTISYFENKPKRKEDTFVMIGWSGSQRLDHPTRYSYKPMSKYLDECWATIKIADGNLKTFIGMSHNIKTRKSELDVIHWLIARYYQNVLGLQNYLKVNKIPYVFYNSLQPMLKDGKKDHKWWFNAVDKTKFFKLNSSHFTWVKENNLSISKVDEHPNGEGHTQWAEDLYKYILEKGLINEI
jgi:hypothetical protein